MKAYFAEENPIKADGIAVRQLRALREHQGPREKKLRLEDVKGKRRPQATAWSSGFR